MMRKLSIFAAIVAAIVFAPAMAFASAALGQGGTGWFATTGIVLGIAALGAAVSGARAEDDKDEKDKGPEAGDDPPEDAGTEPSGACASCGMSNDENAKFCDQCGASMAAQPLESENDDKPPPSSRPGATAPVAAAKRLSMEGSVASILGASSESVPAVKTRAIDLRQVFDTAAGVTGQSEPGAIVGALLTVPERLRAGDKAAADLKRQKATRAQNDRADLAKRLNALGLDGWPRSMIYEDKIGADDKRTIALRPVIAQMDLSVLRGMVESYEGANRRKPRDPFQPSQEKARAAALAADPRKPPKADAPAADVIAWGKAQPVFANIRKQTPQTITDEQIARQLAVTMQPRGVQ